MIEAYVVGNCQDSTKYRIDACWELLLWVTKGNKFIHPSKIFLRKRKNVRYIGCNLKVIFSDQVNVNEVVVIKTNCFGQK